MDSDKASPVTRGNQPSSELWGYGQMWQTEGPTRAPALRWAWTRGAQEARSRPVLLDTVRGTVMESGGRQGAHESRKDLADKHAFHFKKNGKTLEGFRLERYMI